MGELNKRNAEKQKGASSEALFDFVDIDHYVMPTLHLMLGIVNGEIELTSQETRIGRAEQEKLGQTERRDLRSIV